jgi:N-acetyl-beta-hexosaminidase
MIKRVASSSSPSCSFRRPRTTVSGAQQLEHRGFMIDMTRMKEVDEYYFDLVDQLALFGYNALYLHFSDDQGLTVELESHPELVSAMR